MTLSLGCICLFLSFIFTKGFLDNLTLTGGLFLIQHISLTSYKTVEKGERNWLRLLSILTMCLCCIAVIFTNKGSLISLSVFLLFLNLAILEKEFH